jgi:hypothetical protein
MDYTLSPGRVRLANDFRDNLIIDRYDEALTSMRGSKREAMRSENSEDVVTWNVFRSLAQIDPALWLLRLQETVLRQFAQYTRPNGCYRAAVGADHPAHWAATLPEGRRCI